MGLAICRSIIELHDGRLWPQDHKAPGTTFCFTLPVPDHRMPEVQHSGDGRRLKEYVCVGQAGGRRVAK